jgi:hypothetical protein
MQWINRGGIAEEVDLKEQRFRGIYILTYLPLASLQMPYCSALMLPRRFENLPICNGNKTSIIIVLLSTTFLILRI